MSKVGGLLAHEGRRRDARELLRRGRAADAHRAVGAPDARGDRALRRSGVAGGRRHAVEPRCAAGRDERHLS